MEVMFCFVADTQLDLVLLLLITLKNYSWWRKFIKKFFYRTYLESTNLHYYCVEVFYAVIDMQLQELNNRFNEVNIELLLCMACLSLIDSFSASIE